VTPVRYHEAAEDELLNEVAYLELRVPGLGRRFHAEVRRAETLIARFPESAQEILPGIRRYTRRKFRFSLIYSIEKDGVLILAVAHQCRRPRYWVRRLTQTQGQPPTGT
jgi:toxin ParE2